MIGIKEIRLDSISIEKDKDGIEKITGNYSLMSTIDKVLAKQMFNGYSDIQVTWSPETKQKLNQLLSLIKKDCMSTLGIEQEAT